MEKIRILHIISDMNIGGAGKLLYNLAATINKNNFELYIAIPHGSKLKKLLMSVAKVIEYKGIGDKSFEFSSVLSLCKIIKELSPNIVHTHSALSGRIAAKLCHIKTNRIIYTKHCVFDFNKNAYNYLIKRIYRFIDNRLSGHIVAVAVSAKTELIKKGIDKRKISVIINGSLPLEKSSEMRQKYIKNLLCINNEFVVGMVARLEEYKDHKTLLKAAKLAYVNSENIKFIIVGDGSLRHELVNYVNKEGIKDNVIFTGFTEKIAEYMSIFNLNVNCSTGTETSCLAISEGFSLGIPAVASDFGGNPNMVRSGETGYIFPMKNYKELYRIIVSLKNSPSIIQNFSHNAYIDYKNRFSAEQMTAQYEALYYKIIG